LAVSRVSHSSNGGKSHFSLTDKLLDKVNEIYRKLASKKFALYLFIGLALLLIPKTLLSTPNTFLDGIMQAVLGLLAVNLTFCTFQRFKSLRRATLFIHVGMVLTLIGGLISSFGYVATINIHEGSTTDTVFRWDIEQDIPLGFAVMIKKIRREYYPLPVKVGVLNKGEKAGLFTLKTGESFEWQDYKILVDSIDLEKESLVLNVLDKDNKLVGSYDTSGKSRLPSGFPLEFKLVAYRDPVLKKVGAELVILEAQKVLAEGYTEVNAPFYWNDLKFHVTNIAVDDYGFPYVGLQIVRDPGVRFVYIGFVVICLGCLWHISKLLKIGKKKSS
jgi:hypothetical protein